MDLPTLFFIGFALALRGWMQGFLLLVFIDLLLAFEGAGRVFLIQRTGFAGRTTLFVEIADDQRPSILFLADGHRIADFDVLAGFATLTIDMHLAAGDGFGSQAARLEKTRGPQPFIDAYAIEFSQRPDLRQPRL